MAAADLRGTRCAINSPRSHSGINVLQALIAPLAREGNFLAEVAVSGAHERSLQRMLEGREDVAAIDCITYGVVPSARPTV